MNAETVTMHASTVAVQESAVVITGASGSGKSSLALALIGLGADLVADDCTVLHTCDGRVMASAPETIRGQIEVRGVGILHATTCLSAQVALVIDLDQVETQRLPPVRYTVIAGQSLPCLHKVESPYFPAAIMQYLQHGRKDPD